MTTWWKSIQHLRFLRARFSGRFILSFSPARATLFHVRKRFRLVLVSLLSPDFAGNSIRLAAGGVLHDLRSHRVLLGGIQQLQQRGKVLHIPGHR